MKKTFALVMGSLAALQGCDIVEESNEVDTDEMYIDVKLTRLDTADMDTLDVRFETENDIYAYDTNVLQLTKEDTVTVYVDGEPHTPFEVIDESEQDRDVYYRVELPKSQGSTNYRVALTRQDHQDAPDTQFTVPEPPPFTTVPDQVIGVDESLVITWTPDDQVNVRYTNTLNCTDDSGAERIFEDEDKTENSGTFVLDNSAHFSPLSNVERQSLDCDGVFQFHHYDYSGDVDPHFSIGSIHVKQIRTLPYKVSGAVD
ncbi:hypothetical protein [Saccharospirillum salsuginis]|uniref:Lipoprotein n=1 Tax=Saccharospirillum salsuginis TaxID=418750 RepID=A0A918NJF7_9GAMM|nr:hypothetical protein [Saccharospirillum salsuginis]GGX75048.1 hypothetical protein GCM10007392_47810 [Saccharospirillum salsuginis]